MKIAVALILAAATLAAQAPAFDAVSIKPTPSDFRLPANISVPLVLPANGGRTSSPAVTAIGLVVQAFRTTEGAGFRTDHVVGGPSWMTSTRFSFVGTSGPGVSREAFIADMPAMLQTFLADRFKLRTHIESRPFPVYLLVKARADGMLGPDIHESTVDCDATSRDQLEKQKQMSREDFLASVMNADLGHCSTSSGPGRVSGKDMTMKGLVGVLGADRPVFDRTGLAGRFNLDLHWAPPTTTVVPATDQASAPVPSDGPSLFTAVQEQLGLKLERAEELMDVLVIDHIESPAPD